MSFNSFKVFIGGTSSIINNIVRNTNVGYKKKQVKQKNIK